MEPSELRLPGGQVVYAEYDEATRLHTLMFTTASGAQMRKIMTSEELHEFTCKLLTLYAEAIDITPEKVIEGEAGGAGGWVTLQ